MTQETPPSTTSALDRLLNAMSALSMVISGIALVVLTVIFGWLVFGRYVLNATPTWVEQAALLLVTLIAFLGASVGVHQNTHLGVTYFRDVSPPAVRRFFTLLSHVILAIFGTVMMVYSYKLVLFKWGTAIPLIHIPEGLRAVPIMICGGAITLYCIGHIIRFFRQAPSSPDVDQ